MRSVTFCNGTMLRKRRFHSLFTNKIQTWMKYTKEISVRSRKIWRSKRTKLILLPQAKRKRLQNNNNRKLMETNQSNRNTSNNKKRRWSTIKTNKDSLQLMSFSHYHNSKNQIVPNRFLKRTNKNFRTLNKTRNRK